MIVSRLISVALYIIVVVIMGFLLAGILLTPFMVIETSGSASYGIFVPLMNRKLAWIYLGIMAFNLALSIIPVCYLAIIVSIFRPDGYIAIGAAFFLFIFYFIVPIRCHGYFLTVHLVRGREMPLIAK